MFFYSIFVSLAAIEFQEWDSFQCVICSQQILSTFCTLSTNMYLDNSNSVTKKRKVLIKKEIDIYSIQIKYK